MKNPSKKKGLNGRRTKTSNRRAPKRTEKTEKKFGIIRNNSNIHPKRNSDEYWNYLQTGVGQ